MRRLAERDFEDIGDKMRFNAMVLAEFGAGAGSVEITEGDKFKTVNLIEYQLRIFFRG